MPEPEGLEEGQKTDMEPEGPPPDATADAEEGKALETGWLPQDQFRGNPDAWRDAETWNERGETLIPFIKANSRRLEEKATAAEQKALELEKKLNDTETMVKRMTTVQDKYSGDLYERSMGEIKAKELEAVESADTERYQQLQVEKEAIPKPEPIAPPEPNPEVEEQGEQGRLVMEQWKKENPWFETDPEMNDYAVIIGDRLAKAKDPTAVAGREAEFGAKISAKIRVMFPDKFTNPKQATSIMDESSLRGGGNQGAVNNGSKAWNDLPAAAKQACAAMLSDPRLVAGGLTKEKYAEGYWEGEE